MGKGSVQWARGAAGAENTPGAGIGLRCLPNLLLGPPSACFSPPSLLTRAQFAAQNQDWMETWELSQWRSWRGGQSSGVHVGTPWGTWQLDAP